MFIRSLVTVATVALAGSMVHAQTGPRPGTGGGGGTRTTTVALSGPTQAAVRTVGGSQASVAVVINAAIAPYVGNSTFRAQQVVDAVEAVAVAFQRKAAGKTLTNPQKHGFEAVLKFTAISAALADAGYNQLVQRFLANGVVNTILDGDDAKFEITNALAFVNAAGNQTTSMTPQSFESYIEGLVRQMIRDPANPNAQLSGLRDGAFNPSDCFGAANAAG